MFDIKFLTPLCVNSSCMSCKILLTKYCNLRARHRSLNCLYLYSYHGIIFRITSVTNSCKHFRQRYWSLDGVTLWLITSVKLVISQLFHHFGWLHITMLSHIMMCKTPSEKTSSTSNQSMRGGCVKLLRSMTANRLVIYYNVLFDIVMQR